MIEQEFKPRNQLLGVSRRGKTILLRRRQAKTVSLQNKIWRWVLAGVIFSPLLVSLGTCTQMTNAPAGHIIWWGKDNFWKHYYSDHTNGLIENNDEFLDDVIAVAGGQWQGLALKSDGKVYGFGNNFYGGNDVPAGLSNVVSIAVEGNSCWAIRRDGTVARWGNENGDQDRENIVAGLSNVTAIAWAGGYSYLAIKNDGTVLGMDFNKIGSPMIDPATGLPTSDQSLVQLVKVQGQVLSNVVALASMGMTPIVLKSDGTVFSMGYQTPGKPPTEPRYEVHDNVLYEYLGGESAQLPYRYTSADPVMIEGKALSNVVSLASGGEHALALKKDGTVVAWGNNSYNAATVPTDIGNVAAIAATENESLVLKHDGTVVAWGNNPDGQTTVPLGLSNVVAIASAGDFSLAITTGNIPSSVFIRPHGRLEELEQKADLVFKGQVMSNMRITNAAFNISQMNVSATMFKVISTLKGEALPEVVFEHYSDWGEGGMAWSGSSPPATYKFEPGQTYLIFAARLDKPDSYYSPQAGVKIASNEFRQIADVPRTGDEGTMKTLDARPLAAGLSVKEAHWLELNRLLNDTNPTNVLYAIGKLDGMSLKRAESFGDWGHSDDFKRPRVLSALLPLIENNNERAAISAMSCFEVETKTAATLEPFASLFIKVANKGTSSTRQLEAIRALSGMDEDAVSNSLARLLMDDNENIRAGAVGLLPRFTADFAEQGLRNGARDVSPKVRAAVADAIGNGKIVGLLPVLETLWNDTNIVHTSAGDALLNFEVKQVGSILRAHLNAEDFRRKYLCKLAQDDASPWLTNLVEVLKARRENNWLQAKTSGIRETTNYFNALMALSGTDFDCWNIIHGYLVKLSDSEFQAGKLDWCLDALENAGNTGSREPVMLYELYKTKGLSARAAKFRQENGKCSGFDVTIYFDNIDRQFPNK